MSVEKKRERDREAARRFSDAIKLEWESRIQVVLTYDLSSFQSENIASVKITSNGLQNTTF
jgi:hypothetical protein